MVIAGERKICCSMPWNMRRFRGDTPTNPVCGIRGIREPISGWENAPKRGKRGFGLRPPFCPLKTVPRGHSFRRHETSLLLCPYCVRLLSKTRNLPRWWCLCDWWDVVCACGGPSLPAGGGPASGDQAGWSGLGVRLRRAFTAFGGHCMRVVLTLVCFSLPGADVRVAGVTLKGHGDAGGGGAARRMGAAGGLWFVQDGAWLVEAERDASA